MLIAYVNAILETVEARALKFLATAIPGAIDEGLDQLDNLIGRPERSHRRALAATRCLTEIIAYKCVPGTGRRVHYFLFPSKLSGEYDGEV